MSSTPVQAHRASVNGLDTYYEVQGSGKSRVRVSTSASDHAEVSLAPRALAPARGGLIPRFRANHHP
jgi:hypothetical protein